MEHVRRGLGAALERGVATLAQGRASGSNAADVDPIVLNEIEVWGLGHGYSDRKRGSTDQYTYRSVLFLVKVVPLLNRHRDAGCGDRGDLRTNGPME
jgi:hypothetical protein